MDNETRKSKEALEAKAVSTGADAGADLKKLLTQKEREVDDYINFVNRSIFERWL